MLPLICLFVVAEGRVHTVANFIGGDASMPCEVDLTGCGDIYFITWTKNVSNDWQRVFLYSQSYKKVLGDFEVYAQNRVQFRGDTINTTGVAYLTITALDIVDEGVYKCDVTYTRPNINGKCPSLTYTRLHTLGTNRQLTDASLPPNVLMNFTFRLNHSLI